MGDDDRRIREGRHQRPDLFEMLRTFQDPTLARLRPLQDLEPREQRPLVVGRLVVRQVVVAPDGRARDPLEVVAREIGEHELELFVDVVRLHGMHRRDQR